MFQNIIIQSGNQIHSRHKSDVSVCDKFFLRKNKYFFDWEKTNIFLIGMTDFSQKRCVIYYKGFL